jgi:hypothetical protein
MIVFHAKAQSEYAKRKEEDLPCVFASSLFAFA